MSIESCCWYLRLKQITILKLGFSKESFVSEREVKRSKVKGHNHKVFTPLFMVK